MRDIRDVSPPKRWTLVVSDEPDGIARWNPSRLPEGEFRINGVVDMKRDSTILFGLNDTLFIDWTLPTIETDSLELSAGWNIVSCPLLPTEVPAGEIFQTDLGVFRYVTALTRYDFAYLIQAGEGYWVWSDSAKKLPFAGSPLAGFRRQIYRGWNLIGSAGGAIPVSDIALMPSGGIIGAIYTYDGSSYIPADTLVPGKGYWLLSNTNGILHVPGGYRR
jgi:hypothetical protein